MSAKYKGLIVNYCAERGITVPPGFARNSPGPYAIVRVHTTPPKLIATTWRKVADVVYFIQNHLVPELGDTLGNSIQILDFQSAELLVYKGGQNLTRVGPIPVVQ